MCGAYDGPIWPTLNLCWTSCSHCTVCLTPRPPFWTHSDWACTFSEGYWASFFRQGSRHIQRPATLCWIYWVHPGLVPPGPLLRPSLSRWVLAMLAMLAMLRHPKSEVSALCGFWISFKMLGNSDENELIRISKSWFNAGKPPLRHASQKPKIAPNAPRHLPK